MRRAALLALALTGCAHGLAGSLQRDYCATRCGLSALDPSICPGLQEQEDVTLDLFDQRGVASHAFACGQLRGFQVAVNPRADAHGVFPDPAGRLDHGKLMRVAGETSCTLQRIAVGNALWHDLSNSLSHELLHVIQRCQDGPDGDMHWQWDARKYFQAIRDCHALPPGFMP